MFVYSEVNTCDAFFQHVLDPSQREGLLQHIWWYVPGEVMVYIISCYQHVIPLPVRVQAVDSPHLSVHCCNSLSPITIYAVCLYCWRWCRVDGGMDVVKRHCSPVASSSWYDRMLDASRFLFWAVRGGGGFCAVSSESVAIARNVSAYFGMYAVPYVGRKGVSCHYPSNIKYEQGCGR